MIRVEDQIEEHLDLCSTYRQQHDSVWATFVFQISPGVVSARARPDTIVDRAGRPVGLNFRREETASCSHNVIFADFGKSADLPAGENVAVGFVPHGDVPRTIDR